MNHLKIAIVGRPNVGKSTLFNRLCGRRIAMVTDIAGTTRDLKDCIVDFDGLRFIITDTAGWECADNISAIRDLMLERTIAGINDADLVLFVVEARNHLTSDDLEFARIVRKSSKNTLLVVNKSESKIVLSLNEIMQMGFGEPLFISSEHGIGMKNLCATIREKMAALVKEGKNSIDNIESNEKLLLAIVGRPNAGKSTIFNCLLGFERNITSSEPGTTRDSVTHDISFDDMTISLIDTAGLRKKSKVYEEIEKLSVAQTITAIRRGHVVVVVVDATQGFEQQDLKIATIAINEGKGLILLFNKIDLVENKKQLEQDIQYIFEHTLTDIVNIPVIYTNAISGRGVSEMLKQALQVRQHCSKSISTSNLNKWLEKSVYIHQPSFTKNGRRIKVKYITQIKSRPPTFKLFANTDEISLHYKRYLSHSLQKEFDFIGTPIRMQFAVSANPYED